MVYMSAFCAHHAPPHAHNSGGILTSLLDQRVCSKPIALLPIVAMRKRLSV